MTASNVVVNLSHYNREKMNLPLSLPNSSAFSSKSKFSFTESGKLKRIIFLFTLVPSMFMIKAQKPKASSGKAAFGDWGIETKFISKSVKPGNDFYTYVNEGWLKSSAIPPGASGFNSYSEAKDKINSKITDMIRKGANAGHSANQSLGQISSVYSAYLDTDHLDKLGIKPIENDLKNILAIHSYEEAA